MFAARRLWINGFLRERHVDGQPPQGTLKGSKKKAKNTFLDDCALVRTVPILGRTVPFRMDGTLWQATSS
jgi:hypothetical protein